MSRSMDVVFKPLFNANRAQHCNNALTRVSLASFDRLSKRLQTATLAAVEGNATLSSSRDVKSSDRSVEVTSIEYLLV